MPDSKVMVEYVKSVTDTLDKKNGKGLSTPELRLGRKLREVQSEIKGIDNDIGRIRETLQQAQQRLDMMTRDHLHLVIKASGFVESLIALKFGDEIEKEETKKAEEVAKKKAKGNGAKDQSPPPKRKKRVKKSKKIQPAAP